MKIEDTDFKYVGKEFKAARLRQGMTQVEVADVIGISIKRLSQIEKGDIPSAAIFAKLVKLYNLSADILLNIVVSKSRNKLDIIRQIDFLADDELIIISAVMNGIFESRKIKDNLYK